MGNESLKAFLEDFVGVELVFLLDEWTLELKWQGSYHRINIIIISLTIHYMRSKYPTAVVVQCHERDLAQLKTPGKLLILPSVQAPHPHISAAQSFKTSGRQVLVFGNIVVAVLL